jgi:hypothetical protein
MLGCRRIEKDSRGEKTEEIYPEREVSSELQTEI